MALRSSTANDLSQSRTGSVPVSVLKKRTSRIGRRIFYSLSHPGPLPHRVGRPLHGAEIHPGQIFADDAQGQQLGARKEGDDRGQEGKARHGAAPDSGSARKPAPPQPEQGERETHHAGQLQRAGGEASHSRIHLRISFGVKG